MNHERRDRRTAGACEVGPWAGRSGGDQPMPLARWSLWMGGFVVLFAFNALMESLVLPRLGMEHTPRNDWYFQSWWIAVGIWLVFGNVLLVALGRWVPGRR